MVTFPRYLPKVKWSSALLELERFESVSQSGGRVANVVEYADPLWRLSMATKAIPHLQMRPVEAWWESLRGALKSVIFQHPSYFCPVAHIVTRGPEGQAGTVQSVRDGNIITVAGCAPQLKLSPGDFLTFEQGGMRGVGRVIDVSGAGGTREVYVEPSFPRHIPLGSTVRFDRLELIMRAVPGSWTLSPGNVRTASFQLVESRT